MSDEKKKNILILGAGLMQKPAILAAKELGARAIVVDANPKALCVPLADYFEPIDLKDRDALVAFADRLEKRGEKLSAAFTAGTDFSASVAYVAEHCALRAHSFESCLNASDKLRMRACFKQYGVPSPGFIEVKASDIAHLSSLAERGLLEFPKVVKPCDNMGGRGCRLVRSKEEFLPAVQAAVRASRTERAILEDYMEGAEFSIDSVVYNGTLTITGFADRHIYYPPYFIEMGHTMPTVLGEKERLELIATFALGIKALGLSCGVAKADIKYTKNGPMIGEIAARLSGGYMSGWTYPYASDVPLTRTALEVALGEQPAFLEQERIPLRWMPHPSVAGEKQPFELYELPCKRTSAERAWLSIPGVVREITGMEEGAAVPGVRDVLPRVKAGDTVAFPRNNVEKCGNIIAVAPTRDAAERACYNAIRGITVRLEPHTASTDAFLSGACEIDEKNFPPPAFPAALSAYEKALASGMYKDACLKAGVPVSEQIPESVTALASYAKESDWNHIALNDALAAFDAFFAPATRPELSATVFWRAFLRGSVQGALYVADCARAESR